eukprot:COSAG02_NODE_55118_length_292_cov_0.808290_1_plen_20_part_01
MVSASNRIDNLHAVPTLVHS